MQWLRFRHNRRFRVGALLVLTVVFVAVFSCAVKETSFLQYGADLRKLKERNAILYREILLFTSQLVNQQQILKENEELKQMLQLKKTSHQPLVASRVVAVSPLDWERRIKIDAGKKKGVHEGDIVIDPHSALAGVVDTVEYATSWVTLVSDPDFRTRVQVGGQQYLLKGFSDESAKVLYVPYDAEIAPGDPVLMFKHGLAFPNLIVGYVSTVEGDPDVLTKDVTAKIAARTESLRYVFVIADGKENQ
jgi:rod shape-determining protein MreC